MRSQPKFGSELVPGIIEEVQKGMAPKQNAGMRAASVVDVSKCQARWTDSGGEAPAKVEQKEEDILDSWEDRINAKATLASL